MSFLLRSWNRCERIAAFLASIPCRLALRSVGKGVVLSRGFSVNHPGCVSIGDNVFIGEFCWISMLPVNYQKNAPAVALSPGLTIGDNSYIGRFATFACMNDIRIGNDVMISDRVFVGDCYHGHANRDLPIKDQYMFSPGPVSIGDGAWLGINVSVMPNVKIGKQCVIGANSVVTGDIPDYHVAAGIPARVIKTIDDQRKPQ